jgi:hypothetical protein
MLLRPRFHHAVCKDASPDLSYSAPPVPVHASLNKLSTRQRQIRKANGALQQRSSSVRQGSVAPALDAPPPLPLSEAASQVSSSLALPACLPGSSIFVCVCVCVSMAVAHVLRLYLYVVLIPQHILCAQKIYPRLALRQVASMNVNSLSNTYRSCLP